MIVNQCFGTDNRAETCFLFCYDCRKTIESKMKRGNIMKNIKNICHYDSSYELLSETFGDDIFDELTEDEREYLECVDDYEGMSFYVVNEDTVLCCDSNGDVIGNPACLEEFKRDMFDLARAEVYA